MVTPATGTGRIRALDEESTGFLYCVSTTGVTGMRGGNVAEDYLKRIREHARKNPLMVGFGIAAPEDAGCYGRSVDGVIVGSAFISFLATSPSPGEISAWTREFKDGVG